MAMPTYDYEIVARSEDAHIRQGEQVILWVTLKNTGTNSYWYADRDFGSIHMGTSNPKDRPSQFYTRDNWLSNNRVNLADQDQADRDETMSFGWYMSAPAYINPGVYQECFTPVIEDLTWMREDGRLCWNIYVEANPDLVNQYSAEIDWNMSFREVEVNPGEWAEIQFKARNNGSATWYRQSNSPLHLATYNPMDRASEFYDYDWLATNRPTGLVEDEVKPGDVGSFKFVIYVPDDMPQGTYEEDFWLVAEGLTWLNVRSLDSGSPWFRLEVNVDENNILDWYNSSIESNQDVIDGDGKDTATITVTLKNSSDEPLSDVDVDLAGKGCSIDPDEGCEDISFSSQMTDEDGKAEFEFSYEGEANFIFYYTADGQDSWDILNLAAEIDNDVTMCADETCFTENLETCTPAAYNDISELFSLVWYEIVEDEDNDGRCVVYSQIIESDEPEQVDLNMRCHYENADQYPLLLDKELCEGSLVDYFWSMVYGDFDEPCTDNPEVGDICEGGYYLSDDLIVMPGGCSTAISDPFCIGEDYNTYSWGGYGQEYGASSRTDGWYNSEQVYGVNYIGGFEADQETGTEAINHCWEMVLNGYDDWYLPAIDQLQLVYDNRYSIPGIVAERYWSSTESIPNPAAANQEGPLYFAHFRGMADDDIASTTGKGFEFHIRCVRDR